MRIIFLSILPHFIFDIPALSTGKEGVSKSTPSIKYKLLSGTGKKCNPGSDVRNAGSLHVRNIP